MTSVAALSDLTESVCEFNARERRVLTVLEVEDHIYTRYLSPDNLGKASDQYISPLRACTLHKPVLFVPTSSFEYYSSSSKSLLDTQSALSKSRLKALVRGSMDVRDKLEAVVDRATPLSRWACCDDRKAVAYLRLAFDG